MWKFCFLALACALCALGALEVGFNSTRLNYVYAHEAALSLDPLPPNTATEAADDPNPPSTETPVAPDLPTAKIPTHEESRPVRVIIPSIGLNDPLEPMGLNSVGELDVPDGTTNNVGWWKDGPLPGEIGSAVFDAHVYAAFKELRYVKIGDDIHVQTADGRKLRFVVTDTRVFTLEEITSEILFGDKGKRQLNLITCAGKYMKDRATYDHRLVVFTEFAGEL
jgi:LPXTG-site transpeptidase (sortase) family protein